MILFGASGLIGREVLRECLLDGRVTAVLAVGRVPAGLSCGKLRATGEAGLPLVEDESRGYDACLCCPAPAGTGVTGGSRRAACDVTLTAASTLARISPGSRFVYVSGVDAQGRPTGPEAAGRVEEALRALPLEAYALRPGPVRPSALAAPSRVVYLVIRPLHALLRRLAGSGTAAAGPITAARLGQAMITVAERGADRRVLGPGDIDAL
ncbi:epimerase [Nonomuraea sp. MG754425]|uniref:epimerase n=1 Tax=Nonomuraea sp. MG754425 TaxID=2570319 RepID=UPI001F29B895|nr:epimerase [Nonomuraea sp. MG754425]